MAPKDSYPHSYNDPSAARVALVCATELEAGPLRGSVEDATAISIGGRDASRARIADSEVILLPTGVGKTNAAQALTALLESHEIDLVLCFGVGGAYEGSGLQTGDLALATAEIYADEGVITPTEWLSVEDIGLPLLDSGTGPVYNEFPLDPQRVGQAGGILARSGIKVVSGPFATVSNCSGTAARGAELRQRHHAICESMEGAAFAHVAALYEVPFLEVRGMSNLVEDRDFSTWQLAEAALTAANAAAAIVRGLRDPRSTKVPNQPKHT